MSEAPERIWAWCFQANEGGGWGDWGGYARQGNICALDDRERKTGAEYIRADLATAAVTAEKAALVDAILDAIAANPTELNLGNYGHDDVCKLQDEAIDVFQILTAALTPTTDKEPKT